MRFLRSISIACYWEVGAADFLEGVRIQGGELFIDPGVDVSDVLHEAGHLAVLPGRLRHFASANLDMMEEAIHRAIDFDDLDASEARAVLQSGELEATAWAFAAGLHLGFLPEEIILDSQYQGEGALIRTMLVLRQYAGINGLAAAGFCVTRAELAPIYGLPLYPKLAMWVQPHLRKPVSTGNVICFPNHKPTAKVMKTPPRSAHLNELYSAILKGVEHLK